MAVERRVIVPLIVACALFMQNLDSTALATALPSIAASLNETPLRLHLIITSFMLSLAAFLPVSGWVADRFGARTIFRLAIAASYGWEQGDPALLPGAAQLAADAVFVRDVAEADVKPKPKK